MKSFLKFVHGRKTILLVLAAWVYVAVLIHKGTIDAEVGLGLIISGLIPLAMNHRTDRYHRDLRDHFDRWDRRFGSSGDTGGGGNKSKRDEYGI